MLTRFAKAPGVAAILVVAAIFIIWDANLYGKDENRLIADKEKTTMAVSQTKLAIPPIDVAVPAKFQTATFALG